MKNIVLNDIFVKENDTLRHTMKIIDKCGLRTAYVIKDNGQFVGIVTDSEVRKVIIKGINPDDPINTTTVINKDPVILHRDDLDYPYIMKKAARLLLKLMPDNDLILVTDSHNKPDKLLHLSEVLKKKKSSGHNIKAKHNILVVGGAGYLGSVVVQRLLKNHHKVRVLDSLLYGLSPIEKLVNAHKIELVEGDVRNISTIVRALNSIDAVINLAALVGDPACRDKPETAIETNYFANKALAEACRYNQINRYIFASTCSVYGQMIDDKPLNENSPLNPVSLYARSKIQSEEGILGLEDDNFAPTILRMGTLYGLSPRMRFDLVVNTMVKTAFLEKKVYVKNGGLQWRPLLHIEDATDAYVKCLEAPIETIKGEVFNVGSSKQNYRILDIAKIVERSIPGTKMIREPSNNDNRNYLVDFAKIRNTLGFIPKHTLSEEVKKMYRLLRSKRISDFDNPIYYNSDFNG